LFAKRKCFSVSPWDPFEFSFISFFFFSSPQILFNSGKKVSQGVKVSGGDLIYRFLPYFLADKGARDHASLHFFVVVNPVEEDTDQ